MASLRAAKRRRLSPDLKSDRQSASERLESASGLFVESTDSWTPEQQYERRAQKQVAGAGESLRLPIKTAEGRIEHVHSKSLLHEDSSSIFEPSEEDPDARSLSSNTQNHLEAVRTPVTEQIINAKQEFAKLAAQLNENPEGNIDALRRLNELTKSSHTTIVKLALATQVAVYRDIIPGYRILSVTTTDRQEQVSKDVRRLRHFEQTLLKTYGSFVEDLASFAKKSRGKTPNVSISTASAALACTCNLLLAASHFNYRKELLKIIVEFLFHRDSVSDHAKCIDTLETLFREDQDGAPSFEAITLLAKAIRDHKYSVNEHVINMFLHLRLLTEFSSKASRERVDQHDAPDQLTEKTRKSQRHFRTKKQRKILKEQKKMDKDFREADAVVDYEHRDRLQAETLKIVFSVYFRILKERKGHLMGAVLEGLAKFAHLINQDFFGDLLEVLRSLINEFDKSTVPPLAQDSSDSTAEGWVESSKSERSTLLCVNTAIALLEGQDVTKSASSIGIDLTYFTKHLYAGLYDHAMQPNIESSSKPARATAPEHTGLSQPEKGRTSSKINVQTTAVLLIRALRSSLAPRSTPPPRLAAFIKQLYVISLHLPERSSVALMALIGDLLSSHSRKVAGLWNTEERKGDGVFDPLRKDPDSSNPFTTNIWEGELLRHHFCPTIRDSPTVVEKPVGARSKAKVDSS